MAKSEQDPGLPIKVNPASNGELYPPPPNEIAVQAARRTLQFADRAARTRGHPTHSGRDREGQGFGPIRQGRRSCY